MRGNTPRLVSRNPTHHEKNSRAGGVTLARRSNERYRWRTMQTTRTVCEDMQRNDTLCEDAWETILPRGAVTNDTVTRTCKETILFARTCGERYPHENIQQAIPVGPSGRHTLVTNKGPREVRAVIPSQVIQGASSLVRMSLRTPGTSHPYWRYSKSTRQVLSNQKETATRKPEG